ncbi:MAG: transglycosylase SLT domain-containing protein [Deltaproteobacteria bacterium]|nr:transglycosylase SLT domain-containing protein [Deltaproteobacteria bacterium]
MKPLCIALIAVGLMHTGIAKSEPEPLPPSPLLTALSLEAPLDFCGEPVPIRNQEIRERFEKEMLLSLWNRAQVLLWLKRSQRHLPLIEQMLRSEGLPSDLKYVAVAESALLEHARSYKGAVGIWQFMPETGKKYGLTVNRHFDERRDFIASTRAAVRYFRELHALFGSWTLSAAAFNMGEDRLAAEIRDQGTDDYYRLYLPLETQRFLFRILSVKRILSDPEAYGFRLSEADYYPPVSFDELRVVLKVETPLRVIAGAAGTYFKNIRDLNPAIRSRYLPKGTHRLRLPPGASKGFHARLAAAMEAYLSLKEQEVYVVRKGDNLSAIAARFDVPLTAVLLWNRLDPRKPIHPDPRKPIHPGQRLFIYPKPSKTAPEEEGADTEPAP